jgi:hypothetical protein
MVITSLFPPNSALGYILALPAIRFEQLKSGVLFAIRGTFQRFDLQPRLLLPLKFLSSVAFAPIIPTGNYLL